MSRIGRRVCDRKPNERCGAYWSGPHRNGRHGAQAYGGDSAHRKVAEDNGFAGVHRIRIVLKGPEWKRPAGCHRNGCNRNARNRQDAQEAIGNERSSADSTKLEATGWSASEAIGLRLKDRIGVERLERIGTKSTATGWNAKNWLE